MLEVIRLLVGWMLRVLVPRHMPSRVGRCRAQGMIILVMFARSVHRKGCVNLGNEESGRVYVLPKLRLPQDDIVAMRVILRQVVEAQAKTDFVNRWVLIESVAK